MSYLSLLCMTWSIEDWYILKLLLQLYLTAFYSIKEFTILIASNTTLCKGHVSHPEVLCRGDWKSQSSTPLHYWIGCFQYGEYRRGCISSTPFYLLQHVLIWTVIYYSLAIIAVSSTVSSPWQWPSFKGKKLVWSLNLVKLDCESLVLEC